MNGSRPQRLLALSALLATIALPMAGCYRAAPHAIKAASPAPIAREARPATDAPALESTPAAKPAPTPVAAPTPEKSGSALLGDPPTMPVDVPHTLPRAGKPMPWQTKSPIRSGDGC